MIERTIRVARSFEEAAELDRQDVAAMSLEERISGVERLRRARFGPDQRMERVLVSVDLASLRRRRAKRRKPRR